MGCVGHTSARLPTNVSGSAGISLSGGGGGSANDNLSLVAKAKTGDYAGGNGSKSSVELGWGGGSNGTSSYSLDLAGDFATNAEGVLETTVTQDEFDINADSSSNGNDWFRAKHDAKSNVVTDTVGGGWTRHSETKTDNHQEVSLDSNGNSSFLLGLSKATGGDASGSVDLDFSGGSGDQWHVKNKTEREWEDRFDGYELQIHKGESVNKYELDDVYTSSYRGDPSATLNADGSTTSSGSTRSEEDYTFDQVSSTEDKWSDETSYSYSYEDYGFSQQDLYEHEYNFKTTDHYEAELTSDAGATATSATLSGSDAGYTEHEWFDKTCHTWETNGTPGGPDCNQSTWTTREDWPSLVDEMLAMLEYEADMEAAAEGMEANGITPACISCSEIEDSAEEGTPPGSGGFFDSLSNSWGGMQDTYTSLILSHWYGLPDEGQRFMDRAYIRSPLGQTRDSSGVYYYGTRGALAVSVTATALAGAIGGAEAVIAGKGLLSIVAIKDHVAGVVFYELTVGELIVEGLAASVTTIPFLMGSSIIMVAFAYPRATIGFGANIIDALDFAPPQLPVGQLIQILKALYNETAE